MAEWRVYGSGRRISRCLYINGFVHVRNSIKVHAFVGWSSTRLTNLISHHDSNDCIMIWAAWHNSVLGIGTTAIDIGRTGYRLLSG